MSVVQLGVGGIPTDAQSTTREWVRGVGETTTRAWRGEESAVSAKFNQLKTSLKCASAKQETNEGRSRVIATFIRNEDTDGVSEVEELLSVDVVRHISAAVLFRDLTDDEVAAVLDATENRLADADIEGYDDWSVNQKELRWQMLHGQESYFETAFVLRVKKQGVRSSALRGIFTNINTVVSVPKLSAGMKELVGTLPAGEWLYKPPQVQYVQRGVWSVESEWHWSAKWSIIYGGTMKGHIA